MNAEYLLLTRSIKLDDTGGAPNNVVTIPFYSGTPYRHLTAWAKVTGNGTIDVDFQPRFALTDEGSAVNVADSNITKVFQSAVDELRPPSRGINKHPDDVAPAISPLWELVITNSSATVPVTVNLYIMAAASPGGA